MNDRYLYRAKRTDNGEWVEGFLVKKHGLFFIYSIVNSDTCRQSNYEVDPSTICQCTGIKDKSGKLIFENDIVFVTDEEGCSGQVDTGIGEVIFLEGLWYIDGRVQNGLYDIDKSFYIEVIGSIFDNPELLEVEE